MGFKASTTALNTNCVGVKVFMMKIFLALIILVMAFGGYSAASHAMGSENCSSAQEIQNDNCSPHVQNSPDHAKKHDSSGNGVCLDCAHCCTASVVLPVTQTWGLMPLSSDVNVVQMQFQPENRLFSLLRPPKTLA